MNGMIARVLPNSMDFYANQIINTPSFLRNKDYGDTVKNFQATDVNITSMMYLFGGNDLKREV